MYKKIFLTAATFILSMFACIIQAQMPGIEAKTPGNITGVTPIAWLTPDGYSNGVWKNRIKDGESVGDFTLRTGTDNPRQTVGFNYHAGALFATSGDNGITSPNALISTGTFTADNKNVTLIVVFQRTDNTRYDYLIGFSEAMGTNQNQPLGTLVWDSNNSDQLDLRWATTSQQRVATINKGVLMIDNANQNNTLRVRVASDLGGYTSLNSNVGNSAFGNKRIELGANGKGTYGFDGIIQEVIILSAGAAGTYFTEPVANWQKLNTYLAVKYGIKFGSNYLTSKGITVWDILDNNGYNDVIFGIGRDDDGGLYQRQAKSDGAIFSAYVGSSIAELNDKNTGTLQDGAYVIFGTSSQPAGNVSYRHDVLNFVNGQAFRAEDKLSFRAGKVYKAQLTGPERLEVNLALMNIPYQYCLVSTDKDFTPANTRIYEINGGKATIELTDKYSFIDFAGYSDYSGGPGGVNNGKLRLWLRADDLSGLVLEPNTTMPDYNTSSSIAWQGANMESKFSNVQTAVSQWRDFVSVSGRTGSDGTVYSTNSIASFRKPVYLASHPLTNYHATIDFYTNNSGYSSHLTTLQGGAPMKTGKPKYSKVFMMVNSAVGANCYPVSFSNDYDLDGYTQLLPGMGFTAANSSNGEVAGLTRLNGYFPFGTRVFEPGSTTLASYEFKNPPVNGTYYTPYGNLLYSFNMNTVQNSNTNGSQKDGNGIGTWYMGGAGSYGHIGGLSYSNHSRSLKGFISEIIMYGDDESSTYDSNKALTREENDKIHSYYAMKYGLTLRPNDLSGTNYNNRFTYKLSNEVVVWDGSIADPNDKYVRFYNNLAAVVRDDASMLDNRQTHSTETGSILHLGVAGKYLDYNGQSNTSSLGNLEAVMFGDDHGADITSVQTAACGEFQKIFNRKWMFHKVKDGTVSLMFGLQNNQATNLEGFNPADIAYFETIKQNNEFFMIVADSPEKLVAGGSDYKAVLPMTWLNGEPQCTYELSDEFTYVTFGFRESQTGCEGDRNKAFDGKRTFKWTQWTRQSYGNTTNKTISKGEYVLDAIGDVKVTGTSVKYENVTATNNSPLVTSSMQDGSIYVWRAQSSIAGQNIVITVDFNTPLIPEFVLGALDGYRNSFERITVVGECENGNVYPTISYLGDPKKSTYKIQGNTVTATWQGKARHDDKNTQASIAFRSGVKRIVITYALTNTPTRDEAFLISPITVRMAPPAPPVNEDGLSFVESVKESDITICQPEEYSFYIGNRNCSPKTVNFTDTLPAGLKWRETVGLNSEGESLNLNLQTAITQTSNGRDVLNIDNLVIPGDGILILTTTVYIVEGAVPDYSARTFSNRAALKYEQIVTGTSRSRTLLSKDRYSLEDYTDFTAEWALREDTVQLEATATPEIYRANSEILVTLKVNNPNDHSFTSMYLEISYDALFTYVQDSYSDGTNGMVVDTDSKSVILVAGSADGLSGFTLPAGETEFTFKLQAPDNPNLETTQKASLHIAFSFSSDMTDPCVIESVNGLSDELFVPYAGKPTHIMVNKHTTRKLSK